MIGGKKCYYEYFPQRCCSSLRHSEVKSVCADKSFMAVELSHGFLCYPGARSWGGEFSFRPSPVLTGNHKLIRLLANSWRQTAFKHSCNPTATDIVVIKMDIYRIFYFILQFKFKFAAAFCCIKCHRSETFPLTYLSYNFVQ